MYCQIPVYELCCAYFLGHLTKFVAACIGGSHSLPERKLSR